MQLLSAMVLIAVKGTDYLRNSWIHYTCYTLKKMIICIAFNMEFF